MKTYDEMAESVLHRIDEYKVLQKKKRKTIAKVATSVTCISLMVLSAVVLWFSGLFNLPQTRNIQNNVITIAPTNSIFVPKIKLPKVDNGTMTDMIGLVVYKGSIYTQAHIYYGTDAENNHNLVGKYLGYATGKINERSNKSDYEKEFASTFTGNIYSVNGYSDDFRICSFYDYMDDNDNRIIMMQYFEKLNDISLSKGEDLFGQRLKIKGNINSIKYQNHDNWNSGKNSYENLPDLSEDQINSFINDLYIGRFEDISKTSSNFYIDNSKNQKHLYLQLRDNTVVELRLFEDGYVGYQCMPNYLVKMPGTAFNTVFDACK